MNKTLNKWLGSFGRYIAGEPSNKRRDPGTRIQSSDALLSDSKRKRTIEGARDLFRNYSVAAWAVRKHLDYVSTFTFQAATEDTAFNERLEALMEWWSRPLNCDVAQRHGLRRMIRLAEARRVLDGDVFMVKLTGGQLQCIEGDRVRNEGGTDGARTNPDGTEEFWVHGIKLGTWGQVQQVKIHKRHLDGTYTFERNVPAGRLFQLGYFDSFDQVRGVSPLTSAIADLQDSLEVKDYARAKAKVTQLFALAITREMADQDDEEVAEGQYEIDFGKGPVKVELDPGDKAEFLESRHPSTEFQAFLQLSLQAALKALDIPWSFYDEAYTNFFGSRAALIQYQQSCRSKREDLKELLDRITLWKIQQWVAEGLLVLPEGYNLTDIYWDWIPAGVPWWNPEQEVNGAILSINAGLRTRSEIRRELYGDDWRDVARKIAEENDFLREIGLEATIPGAPAQPRVPGQQTTQQNNGDSQQ